MRRSSSLAGLVAALIGSAVAPAASAKSSSPAAAGCDPAMTCPAAAVARCDQSSATCPAAPVARCAVSSAACPAAPDTILSNETTFTTWAGALTASPVRQAPSAASARVGTLHFSTEDGLPEVYIVLRERQVGSRAWALVRLPVRPAGRTGWVPSNALDTFNRITTELILSRRTERLRLLRAGRLVLQVPAGVGTAATPTPAGHFWIREAFPVSGAGPYGPFAFGTSAYGSLTDWPGGGVVGLHGTDQPQLVPGHPSHGCIRVRNADILRLSRLVSVGTPLLVQ